MDTVSSTSEITAKDEILTIEFPKAHMKHRLGATTKKSRLLKQPEFSNNAWLILEEFSLRVLDVISEKMRLHIFSELFKNN